MALAILIVLISAAGSQHLSAAPRFVCYPVHAAGTASQTALRLTGDARNLHEPWFQIFDPVRSRFIPKAPYTQIESGWRACIAEGMAPASIPAEVQEIDVIFRWWWVLLLFSATVLAWIIAENHADRRQATFGALEQFGQAFVREFARPLIQQPRDGDSPLKSRLRIIPHRKRLEILLAPNDGRHYPNLSDHRKNVEYDVERVMTLLGDSRFVCGQLGARGPWVVIPFRLEAGLKQEGAA